MCSSHYEPRHIPYTAYCIPDPLYSWLVYVIYTTFTKSMSLTRSLSHLFPGTLLGLPCIFDWYMYTIQATHTFPSKLNKDPLKHLSGIYEHHHTSSILKLLSMSLTRSHNTASTTYFRLISMVVLGFQMNKTIFIVGNLKM